MARPTRGSDVHLLHPGFVAAGSSFLIAALVTDLIYYNSANWQWANFSAWLITGGLLLALLAVIFLLLDVALGRAGRISWLHFSLLAVAALLSLANIFVHSRDAWTSVVPQGILLSAVVSILLLIISLRGWSVTAIRNPAARGDTA